MFYALRRSRVPVVVSISTIALNIAVNLALVRFMGFRGLALGTSLAAISNGAILLFLLRGLLNGIDGGRLLATMIKISVAAVVMGAVAVAVERSAAAIVPGMGLIEQAARLTAAIVCGLVALAAAAKILRIEEFDDALASVRRAQKLL